MCELSGFVLGQRVVGCHESPGETFCSADLQVEGRTALWTCVFNDDAHDRTVNKEDFHRRSVLAGDSGRLCTVSS